jgi:putative redox protein
MNPTMTVHYLGNLRCRGTHLKSGETLWTDAPPDNNGKGESFSPTDLMCTSLAACMITIMGITAEKKELDLQGVDATIIKVMANDPRRVAEIKIAMKISGNLDDRGRRLLQAAALACPVARSLHPDINQDVVFEYV